MGNETLGVFDHERETLSCACRVHHGCHVGLIEQFFVRFSGMSLCRYEEICEHNSPADLLNLSRTLFNSQHYWGCTVIFLVALLAIVTLTV